MAAASLVVLLGLPDPSPARKKGERQAPNSFRQLLYKAQDVLRPQGRMCFKGFHPSPVSCGG